MGLPYFGLLIVIASAIFFFRVAQYERMSPLVWSISSLAVSVILMLLGLSVGILLLAQFGLFIALWWHNAQRSSRP